jgi:hypothetical protein
LHLFKSVQRRQHDPLCVVILIIGIHPRAHTMDLSAFEGGQVGGDVEYNGGSWGICVERDRILVRIERQVRPMKRVVVVVVLCIRH